MRSKPLIGKSLSLFPALLLSLCLVAPALAGREWWHKNTDGSWSMYNYLNFERYASVGESEWGGPSGFCTGCSTQRYFLNYVTNYTTEGHCYEVEIAAPENYPTATVGANVYFWDNAAGKWNDLLGYALKGKGRVWVKNSEFPMYLAEYSSSRPHAGYYLHRRNLTQTQCTTGQTTMNWLAIIDGVQTKNIKAR